jgi:hypothetical protein
MEYAKRVAVTAPNSANHFPEKQALSDVCNVSK